MFNVLRFKKVAPSPIAVGEHPPRNAKYKSWCVIPDGRVAYIDHYKADGKFGVRPVNVHTGLHYPNPAEHWTEEDRRKYPEELALKLADIRAATYEEIPRDYRT